MIHLSRTGPLAIELGKRLVMSHIAVENCTDLACLPIAKYPGRATLVEQKVHLFQCLLGCFLLGC